MMMKDLKGCSIDQVRPSLPVGWPLAAATEIASNVQTEGEGNMARPMWTGEVTAFLSLFLLLLSLSLSLSYKGGIREGREANLQPLRSADWVELYKSVYILGRANYVNNLIPKMTCHIIKF